MPSPARPAGIKVPFDNDLGLVWVAVSVRDAGPLSFVLDTGFEGTVIDASLAGRLGLQVEEPQLVPQPGGAVEVGAVIGVALAIGDLRVPPVTMQSAPLAALAPTVGRRLDGIIGHDVIEQYVLTIDYDEKLLTFQDPDSAVLPDGDAVALTIVASEPFVEAAIRQPHRSEIVGRFKLDTGSLDAAGLNKNFLEDADVLAPGQPTRTIPGVAVGGETDGLLFAVDGLVIGQFVVDHPTIGATLESAGFENRADAGTIGAEILRRFTITLDYGRSQMILAPNAQFGDPPATDRSGMRIVADGDDFSELRVQSVLEPSPAAAAGIQQGDLIATADGRAAAEMRLGGLWRLCRQPANTPVALDLRRGEEQLSVRVTLQALV